MKKGVLSLLAVLLFPVFALSQTTLPPEARSVLEQAVTVGAEAKRVLELYPVAPPPPELPAPIPVGGNVQAALDAGGIVVLEAGAVYDIPGLRFTKSGTTLLGNGATLRSTVGQALYVLPNVDDIYISGLILPGAPNGSVVQIGDSSATTQGALELVPQRIKLVSISIPTHRGQRAFSIHGAHVELLNSFVDDTYSPALVDSQAIWIHNTPGPVLVDGGAYAAGSEIVMVGGDTQKIAGLIPADLTFQNLCLCRPLSWRTDGIKRGIKNIFELKSGERVKLYRVVMDGSWSDAQISFAIVLTPRQGGGIRDVLFDTITVRNVGGGFNIMGINNSTTQPPTPFATTGIRVVNSDFTIQEKVFGGHGYLAMLQGNPGTFEFITSRAVTDDYYGTLIGVEPGATERIWLKDSQWMTPFYTNLVMAIRLATGATVADTQIIGNRIAGAGSNMKAAYPSNTYVTAAEF
jgi:hypothetical protein